MDSAQKIGLHFFLTMRNFMHSIEINFILIFSFLQYFRSFIYIGQYISPIIFLFRLCFILHRVFQLFYFLILKISIYFNRVKVFLTLNKQIIIIITIIIILLLQYLFYNYFILFVHFKGCFQ